MTGIDRSTKRFRTTLAGIGLVLSLAAAGCQVHVAGKTLPSPYYMSDDLQYFAPGHEFKLANEAAAMRAQAADVISVPPGPVGPGVPGGPGVPPGLGVPAVPGAAPIAPAVPPQP